MIMKKRLIQIFILLFLINNWILYGNDSISVTYIANCGFLIEIDGQKIIVDGLFKLGHNRYPTPDTTVQKLLVSNQYPFNNINLILISHTHEDHFDNEMVMNCMLNNPAAILLCPQQVVDLLSENETVYKEIKTRIIACTPDTYTSHLIHINDIEIYACRLPHVGEKYKNVQNIAFLISVKGKSVFHTGDTDPHQIYNYTGIKISELNVDIGLLNEDFGKIENAGYAREFVDAKHNIAMHFPDSVAIGWLDSLKNKPDLFPDPYIFIKKMERKVFYTESPHLQ
jgi:L-ascorbate metabolism protein UlaG (beta-lactamase superfamily)